ncbi:hypothetical protein CDAR_274891, partial [Caerostris darwini]
LMFDKSRAGASAGQVVRRRCHGYLPGWKPPFKQSRCPSPL